MTNPAWLGTVAAKLGDAKFRGRCYSTGGAIRAGDRVAFVRRCGALETHSAASPVYEIACKLAAAEWLNGGCGARWFDVTRNLYPELFPA
jgi:hypothetical protein